MSKMAERDDKKTLILKAAAEIFQIKDYHEATVEEIAKKAGVGKGTIYQYFPGKQNILDDLYEHEKKEYVTKAKELLLSAGSVSEVIEEIISFHIDNISCAGIFIKSILDSNELNNGKILGLEKEIRETIKMIWQKGLENGEIKNISEGVFSSYLIGIMMSSTVHMVIHQQEKMDLEKVKQEFKQLAISGMHR